MNVVGVQFLPASPLLDCEIVGETPPKMYDRVVVKCMDGVKFGKVLREHREIEQIPRWDFPRIVRVADVEDMDKAKKMEERGREALFEARKMAEVEQVQVAIKSAEYYFDGSRIVFYFVSEDRVDFRDVVRKMSRHFHRRIELRQTGAREAAGHVGGIGVCGLKLCCGNWLREFEPVSIRTAKMQCLNVGSESLTGQCGRLKCCINYEAPVYQEMMKDLPDVGRWVRVDEGVGKVVELDVLKRMVEVRLDPETVLTLPYTQIREIIKGGPSKDVIDKYKGIGPADEQYHDAAPRRRPPMAKQHQQQKNLRDLATEYVPTLSPEEQQAGADNMDGDHHDHDHPHDHGHDDGAPQQQRPPQGGQPPRGGQQAQGGRPPHQQNQRPPHQHRQGDGGGGGRRRRGGRGRGHGGGGGGGGGGGQQGPGGHGGPPQGGGGQPGGMGN